VAEIDRPDWLEGLSLLPLVRGEQDELHEEVFSEVTYHAAYEPQRAVRTARYKYIRRFDERHQHRVLANLDDGLTKDVMLAYGWADVDPPRESLYDVCLDPSEGTSRIDDPALAGVVSDLKVRLRDWMVRTDDPLIQRMVAPAEGTFHNTVDQISPSDPTTPPTTHSATLTHRARNGRQATD
jgi:arylsulfatase A-like enzyme